MITWTQAKHFIESHCVQVKAPFTGQPVKVLDWQETFLKPIFDEPNRYKTISCWVSRKQGKSTIIACLALLYLLSIAGSEVYIICPLLSQADHLFRTIVDFISSWSEDKQEALWVREHIRTIEYRQTRSILKVLSADPRKSSYNASLIIIDELAELPASNAYEVWSKITGSTAARYEAGGLVLTISTAQYNRQHLGYDLFSKAQRIKTARERGEPDEDPTFLPVVYSLPIDEDWTQEANWWKTLPSAGVTVPRQFYLDEFRKTINNPREEAKFRTLTACCQWVGSGENWIASHVWSKAGRPFNLEQLKPGVIFAGLDMSSKHDLSSYMFLAERGDEFFLWGRAFIPEARARLKEKEDRVPYSYWHKQGHIELTPGERIDPQYIINKLVEDLKGFDLESLTYDPYGCELIRQQLENEFGIRCVEMTPTPSRLSPACGFLEREVLAQRLHHNNNPCLDWCINNTCVKTICDKVYLEKRKQTQRIDMVSASLLAIQRRLDSIPDIMQGNPLIK